MADAQHLEILKRGSDEWNRWRNAHATTRGELSDLDYSKVRVARRSVLYNSLIRSSY